LQVFRYISDAQAADEKAKKQEALQKTAEHRRKSDPQVKPSETVPQKAPDSAPQNSGAATKAPGL